MAKVLQDVCYYVCQSIRKYWLTSTLYYLLVCQSTVGQCLSHFSCRCWVVGSAVRERDNTSLAIELSSLMILPHKIKQVFIIWWTAVWMVVCEYDYKNCIRIHNYQCMRWSLWKHCTSCWQLCCQCLLSSKWWCNTQVFAINTGSHFPLPEKNEHWNMCQVSPSMWDCVL